jgi:hypothetical protein
VRHARSDDLDRIDGLLERLRGVDGLKEKSRGVFYRGSKAFLHFHEDAGDLWCDVRLDGVEFERRRATTDADHRSLLKEVLASLS